MNGIAIGTKVFKRTEKLERLLESVPGYVWDVYVADDGKTETRDHIYNREWPFDLTVIDLPYDEGLGAGREAIVQESDEDFLVIVDSDHIIPSNLSILRRVLRNRPELGGVAGAVNEPDKDNFFITGQFFDERDGSLHRTPYVEGKPDSDRVAGHPILYFDFIANAAMFRRECLEDYSWDPEYVIGSEHADFYVGHWKTTDWEFAVCPSVVFDHHPGGSRVYEWHRYSDSKRGRSLEYFLEKWGYEADIVDDGYQWVRVPIFNWELRDRMPIWKRAIGILLFEGVEGLIERTKERYETQ